MSLSATIERSKREREDWRYTPLEKLLALPRAPVKAAGNNLPSLVAEARDRHQIVFIDGEWRTDLSQLEGLPRGILRGNGTDGYFLTLAGRTCLVTAPIELVFVGESAGEIGTRLEIEIGAHTSLSLIEHHLERAGAGGSHVMETHIHLGAQAKLIHNKLLHGQRATAHLARITARVEAGGYYRNFALIKDADLVRNEIEVTLAGPSAQCALNGLMLLRGREHADTLTRIIHAATDGTSRQFYKSIVTDRAQGAFQGKIKVEKGARKTDGRQLSRALLLSDRAEMNAKPELEIHADDVACSHGCTTGYLDAEAMFYLRARGIGEDQARALLLRGFIDEVVDELQEGREYVRGLTEGWLA